MLTTKTIFKIVIPSLFLFGNAHAAPINVTETTDFNNTNTGTVDLGAFDLGVNVVSGSVLRDASGFGDYGDFWDAELLSGMHITAIEITITNHTGEDGFFVGAADNIVGGFGPFNNQAYANLISNGFNTLTPTVGTYPFTDTGQYYFGAATNVGTTTGYDYEWLIHVDGVGAPPVPVPAAVWLFGSGLLGLVGVSRRKRRI